MDLSNQIPREARDAIITVLMLISSCVCFSLMPVIYHFVAGSSKVSVVENGILKYNAIEKCCLFV